MIAFAGTTPETRMTRSDPSRRRDTADPISSRGSFRPRRRRDHQNTVSSLGLGMESADLEIFPRGGPPPSKRTRYQSVTESNRHGTSSFQGSGLGLLPESSSFDLPGCGPRQFIDELQLSWVLVFCQPIFIWPFSSSPSDSAGKWSSGVRRHHGGRCVAVVAVAWLSSPEAEMINGQILFIDGGYTVTSSRTVQ